MKRAIESLLPLEKDLFFALNGSDSVLLDNIMWTLSGRFVWIGDCSCGIPSLE